MNNLIRVFVLWRLTIIKSTWQFWEYLWRRITATREIFSFITGERPVHRPWLHISYDVFEKCICHFCLQHNTQLWQQLIVRNFKDWTTAYCTDNETFTKQYDIAWKYTPKYITQHTQYQIQQLFVIQNRYFS